jgi:UDP-N-acetylmuramoyl-tripeptide--D-alanyl-D-alanine ligase
MGVVRTVRERLNATHEVFVCEMGARHVGDIRELCGIVRPRHGVLTSIGAQHLETFHTLENIARTKYELLDALPPDGMAFVQAGAAELGTPPGNAVRYGLSETPDESLAYRAHGLSASAAGTSFTVTASDGWSQNFTTRLLGAHSVENLLGAIACARTLGVPPEALPGAVRGVEPVPHRLQLIPGDPTVIDDAFNANPKGAQAALDTLKLFGGTKIMITPGLVELGERQAELNEAFGQQAAAVCDHVLLVGRKQTEPIAKGLGDFPNARVFDTFGEAFACAKALPGKDKVILLENDLPDNY